jgi:hypothetical protein
VLWVDLIGEAEMTRRFLLISAFILLSGIVGGAPRSVAAADPASFVGDLGSRALAATLGSQPDREGFIVKSQITWINGPAPIGVDWQLHATNNGYKVTDLIINRISMANAQRDDLISVIQHNSGQVQALLVALREKNASNGITQ